MCSTCLYSALRPNVRETALHLLGQTLGFTSLPKPARSLSVAEHILCSDVAALVLILGHAVQVVSVLAPSYRVGKPALRRMAP